MLAVTIVLKQLGLKFEQINSSFKNLKIVETRYSEEEYKGYKIIIKQESKKLIATVNDKKCMFDVIGSITEDEVFDIVDKIKAS